MSWVALFNIAFFLFMPPHQVACAGCVGGANIFSSVSGYVGKFQALAVTFDLHKVQCSNLVGIFLGWSTFRWHKYQLPYELEPVTPKWPCCGVWCFINWCKHMFTTFYYFLIWLNLSVSIMYILAVTHKCVRNFTVSILSLLLNNCMYYSHDCVLKWYKVSSSYQD